MNKKHYTSKNPKAKFQCVKCLWFMYDGEKSYCANSPFDMSAQDAEKIFFWHPPQCYNFIEVKDYGK